MVYQVFNEETGKHELRIDMKTEEEIEQDQQHRKLVHERILKRKSQHTGKPIPQINIEHAMMEFAKSELTEDTLEEIKEEWKTMTQEELFPEKIAKGFNYVIDGLEREKYYNQTFTAAAKSAKLPSQIQTTVKKNLLNAVHALQQYENDKLKRANSLFQKVDEDEAWMFGNRLFLEIALLRWPVLHHIRNPIALPLSKPIYDINAVNVLIFAEDKQRKNLIKGYIQPEPFAFSTKVVRWERMDNVYKADKKRKTLAEAYDLVFVDPRLKDVVYLLGEAFYANVTIPVVLPEEEEKWIDTITQHINGTQVYIPRGLHKLKFPVGLAQMKEASLVMNVNSALEKIGAYIPNGGYSNILSIELSSEDSPALPLYKNRAALDILKTTKQFQKELKRPREEVEKEKEAIKKQKTQAASKQITITEDDSDEDVLADVEEEDE